MIGRDPRCVFVTDDLGEAESVVVWLGEQGVPCQVLGGNALGGLGDLTGGMASAGGVEVWVKDPDHAPKAELLIQISDVAARLGGHPRTTLARSEAVNVLCEECGESISFPGAEHGTVQDCPHCGAYVDVLDEDEEWEEPERETTEDEAAE